MTSEWLMSLGAAYLDVSHPFLQVVRGGISERERAFEYPSNNGLSAPGKKSCPLRVSWETENRTGAEVTSVITPRMKERHGAGVLLGYEDTCPLYRLSRTSQPFLRQNLPPCHSAGETLKRCPLPNQGFHQSSASGRFSSPPQPLFPMSK